MCEINDDIFNLVVDDISEETVTVEPQIEPDIIISLITDIEIQSINKRIETILEKLTIEHSWKTKCMEGSNTCVEIFLRGSVTKGRIPVMLGLCRALFPKSYHITFKKGIKEIDSCRDLYISKGLLIRNVDSNIIIQNEIIEYTSSIIEKAMDECKGIDLPQATDPIHHMMYFTDINPNIPVLLKKDMPSYNNLWEIEDKFNNDYIPKGKVLGYYTKKDENFCKGPHIVLSPELIQQLSDKNAIPFDILFTQVLVHELAHFMMSNLNSTSSLEAKAMEESLANMLTLKWFEQYKPNDLKYVRHFIDNWQPTLYRFGIWQEYAGVDWRCWRESNKSMIKLKEWFNQCFSAGNIKILIQKYTKEIYDEVFI